MKAIIGLFTLLLLASCGDAERNTAVKELVNFDTTPALMAEVKLNKDVREVILFAFPKADEAENFSFTTENSRWDQSIWDKMFGSYAKGENEEELRLLDYGHQYEHPITLDMDNDEKVQDLIGKIFAIGEARDQAWRLKHDPEIKFKAFMTTYKKLFNEDYPCYMVTKRRNKNRKRCFLKPVEGITKEVQNVWNLDSCGGLKNAIKKYKYKKDDSLSAEEKEVLLFSDKKLLTKIKKLIPKCKELEKTVKTFSGFRGDGKLMVAEMLGVAGEAAGAKLIGKVQSQIDDIDGKKESVIEFDPKTLTFSRFQLAINFHDGNESFETIEFSLEGTRDCKIPLTEEEIKERDDLYKKKVSDEVEKADLPNQKRKFQCKVTDLSVFEIGNSGYFQVDFKMHTQEFRWESDGLSLAIDPVFGVRISGKTKYFYPNGPSRRGIIRIDLGLKK